MTLTAPYVAYCCRETVAERTQLGPYTVPAGVLVWVQLHSLHHSPHNYLLPETYLPERWVPDAQLPHVDPVSPCERVIR